MTEPLLRTTNSGESSSLPVAGDLENVKIKKIRIAYLQHGLSYGGAPMSMYLLQKSIEIFGYDKYLFTTGIYSNELCNLLKTQCREIHIIKVFQIHNNQCGSPSAINFIFKKSNINRFCDLLKERRIDILHINTSVFPQILRFIKTNSNVKIVTHVRELIPRYGLGIVQKYLIEEISQYSDAIIAISDNEAQPFANFRNLHILPNPFNFASIASVKKNSFRESEGIERNTVLVGMIGAFHKLKGHINFLKSIKYALEKVGSKQKVMFLIIGVAEKKPTWERIANAALLRDDYGSIVGKTIKKNKLESLVKLIPYTLSIFDILSDVDIMVRPATTGDPWGRDVIEAMAMKKPLVATGTSQFYIKDGITGYLVPPNDPQALAEKIADLINDTEKRIAFGENGYEIVRSMCDMDKYGQSVDYIYRDILAT